MTSEETKTEKTELEKKYRHGHFFLVSVTLKGGFKFDIVVRGANMKSELKFQESFNNTVEIQEITEEEYNKKHLGIKDKVV